MYSLEYVQDEARTCVGLAQAEIDPDMKVIMMGMALGWLNIAKMFEDLDSDLLVATEIERDEDAA